MPEFILNEVETRILGSLMEKKMTTPEYYPLTLNSLINACNQKSNRVPVVHYDNETVTQGLIDLKGNELILYDNSSRVVKHLEIFSGLYKFINAESAILCVLMLRGPQTCGELKTRTERLYKFSDIKEVSDTLTELENDNYLKKLSRAPGQKESRYIQLFSTPLEENFKESEPAEIKPVKEQSQELIIIKEEITNLRSELNDLRDNFINFKNEFK